MRSDGRMPTAQAERAPSRLQSVLRQLPRGGSERQAIQAGEIDAVIDYGSANVIVFPAARRALLDASRRASAADRKVALDVPARNAVLAALPVAEYLRLLPALEHVELETGDVLHAAGTAIRHVYFPVDCVIGLLTRIDSRRSIGTGLVGQEGMVGVPLALGVAESSVSAVVQVAGSAMRMPAMRFQEEFQRGQPLRNRLCRYVQVELDQARRAAACLSSHRFEQRLACWLLMIGDRTSSREIVLTQEHLAKVLNVRRVSVTLASSSLRMRGLISCSRGRMAILDRRGLESASCSCYTPVAIDAAT